MALLDLNFLEPHRVDIRPRFEGSNINTWIGFKHVMYMLEEALLDTMRKNGLVPRTLYEDHGLCFEIVDSDAKILTACHMDDVVSITVSPSEKVSDRGDFTFKVVASVNRHGKEVKAVSATMRALFKLDKSVERAPSASDFLRSAIHRKIQRCAPVSVATTGSAAAAVFSKERGVSGVDEVIGAVVPEQANAFVWKWHIPYFYCHFNDRLQHSGYLRLMEEVVDLFLADRGISIRTMMNTRDWIPVVPHAQISILQEAEMEETLYTVYTVEDVFKGTTYTSRMDCYVPRAGQLIHTATGKITHGYAKIHDRRDWSLVEFDQATIDALNNVHRHA